MLFIEILASAMVTFAAMTYAFGFCLSRLDRVVERLHADIARREARSVDDELREL